MTGAVDVRRRGLLAEPLWRCARWWGRQPPVLRWGLLLGEMGLLWWSSSRQLAGFGTGWWRVLLHNSAHVVAYGGMATLALLARRGALPARIADLRFAWATAVLYGGVDEAHQHFVPGRTSSFADLVSDGAGAALMLMLLQWAATGEARWRRLALLAAAVGAASVTTATFGDL